MRKLEEIDESTLSVSPYVGGLKLRVSRFTSMNDYVRSEGNVLLNRSVMFDRQECTKVYRSKEATMLLMHISYRALQLFNWIVLHLPKGQDWIQINGGLFKTSIGVKDGRVYNNALNELVRYQIILPTHYKSVYWVNPSYVFSGDRVKKYMGNINVVSDIVK